MDRLVANAFVNLVVWMLAALGALRVATGLLTVAGWVIHWLR